MLDTPPWTPACGQPAIPTEPPTEDALDFVLRSERSQSDLGIDRSRPEVLEVAQIWHDLVLDVQHHAPRERPLTIGSETGHRWRVLGLPLGWVPAGFARVAWMLAPMLSEAQQERRNDFSCPPEALPAPDFTLVDWQDGQPTLHLVPGWTGFVERDGRRRELDSLRAEGRLVPDGEGRLALPLLPEERIVLDTGSGRFALHLVPPGRRVISRARDRVDGPFMAVLACATFLGVLLGITLATSPPPSDTGIIELPHRFAEIFLQPPPVDQPRLAAAQPDPSEGPKAKEKQGKMGRKDADLERAKGDATELSRSELDKEIAEASGVLGALRDGSELDGVLGATGLHRDLLGGIGGLLGAKGVQYGSGGLSSRGGGLGGGGTAWGVGGLGTKGRGSGDSSYGTGSGVLDGKRELEIIDPGGVSIVAGQLDKAVVDAVIRRHLNQIRHCYQMELHKDPSLMGKVTVRFVIAGDGSVSRSETRSSTLDSAAVESCIHRRFMHFEFPQPKRNGIVIVTYPFLFAPG